MKRKGLGITCLAAAVALVCLTGIYAVAGKGAKAPAAETEESGEAANIVVAEEAEENRSESEESEKENAQKEIAEAPSEAALASTGDLAAALQSEGMAQAARLIETARGLCGSPYRFLGFLPETGFTDISFVCYCLKTAEITEIPVTSYELLYARCLSNTTEEGLPGDLIFFEQSGRLCHVGIYLGEGRMIHCGRMVEEVSLKDGWEDRTAVFGRLCTYGTQPNREEGERYGEEG